MSDNRGGGGGWELTKENIQPLTSGRRMAYLADSLPVRTATGLTDQHQYEAQHLEEIKKLQDIAEKGLDDDPLQPWVEVVKYYEQHFPNMSPAVNGKYKALLRLVLQTFFVDERFKNDRRFVDIMLKSMKDLPSANQIKMIENFMGSGLGLTVSDTYVSLAELYNLEKNSKKASETVLMGIQNHAQPIHRLNEMLTHVQNSCAERLLKEMQEGREKGQRNEGERNFASAVPIHGENNEAVSIRQNLQPAAPATGSFRKPGSSRLHEVYHQRIPIFKVKKDGCGFSDGANDCANFLENVNPQELPNLGRGGRQDDRENLQEASTWKTDPLKNQAPVAPPKFELYAEADSFQSTANLPLPANVNERVLKERVEEVGPDGEEVQRGTVCEKVDEIVVKSKGGTADEKTKIENGPLYQKQSKPMDRPRRNYLPKKEKTLFENSKYKPLPEDGSCNYISIKEDEWWEKREKRQKAKFSEHNKIAELQKQLEEIESVKQTANKLTEQLRLADLKLMQKDKKVMSLEAKIEEMNEQLTRISTENNVRESKHFREKQNLEYELQESNKIRDRLEQELLKCRRELESLRQEKVTQQQMKDDESSEYEGIIITKNSTVSDRQPVILDVRSRNSDSYSAASSSVEQGSSEVSRFNSGDTTCAAVNANSFLPNESVMGRSDMVYNSESFQGRKALVDRPLGNDMMNDTPATAPPLDLEIPPLSLGFGLGGSLRKPARFQLYESFSMDASTRRQGRGSPVNTKAPTRNVFANEQENAAISVPPTRGASSLYSDENVLPPASHLSGPSFVDQRVVPSSPEVPQRGEPNQQNAMRDSQFLMPDVPSFKRPTFQSGENLQTQTSSDVSQRLAMLSSRPLNDYSPSDDEDEIVRRHQQTGADLNVSNLTCALMLGPKPLINSTPERERTLRNIRGLAQSEIQPLVRNVNVQPEMEEMNCLDYQGGINSRVSRYNSVLNDPPNLRIIQETSREYRSRSTTGSSSGNTMSATRFGLTGTTGGTTPYFGSSMTRSASIPRSANRMSQQQSIGYNGYYSDTNANPK